MSDDQWSKEMDWYFYRALLWSAIVSFYFQAHLDAFTRWSSGNPSKDRILTAGGTQVLAKLFFWGNVPLSNFSVVAEVQPETKLIHRRNQWWRRCQRRFQGWAHKEWIIVTWATSLAVRPEFLRCDNKRRGLRSGCVLGAQDQWLSCCHHDYPFVLLYLPQLGVCLGCWGLGSARGTFGNV